MKNIVNKEYDIKNIPDEYDKSIWSLKDYQRTIKTSIIREYHKKYIDCNEVCVFVGFDILEIFYDDTNHFKSLKTVPLSKISLVGKILNYNVYLCYNLKMNQVLVGEYHDIKYYLNVKERKRKLLKLDHISHKKIVIKN